MRTKKIFIVDDSSVVTVFLGYAFQNDPRFTVKILHSGKECLEHMEENPDLILLDYYLSDMTGLEVMNKLKGTSYKAKVVFFSGSSEEELVRQCKAAGAIDFVTKDEKIVPKLKKVVEDFVSPEGGQNAPSSLAS